MFHNSRSLVVFVATACLLAVVGCSPAKLDPRCRVDAGGFKEPIVKSVTRSKYWQIYFDKMTSTSALVEIKIAVDRRTKRSYGGDYDQGTVTVKFTARSLKHRSRLVQKEGTFEIDSFLIGGFDKNASREEIQEVAFKDAEKEAWPYIDRWVNVAAVRAMGLEGKQGSVFLPTLEKLLENQWLSGDMQAAAREALAKIK